MDTVRFSAHAVRAQLALDGATTAHAQDVARQRLDGMARSAVRSNVAPSADVFLTALRDTVRGAGERPDAADVQARWEHDARVGVVFGEWVGEERDRLRPPPARPDGPVRPGVEPGEPVPVRPPVTPTPPAPPVPPAPVPPAPTPPAPRR